MFDDTTLYCTVAQVKSHGIDTTQFTDAQIEDAIPLITAYVDAFFYLNLEEHLGQDFSNVEDEYQHFVKYETKTKTFSGEGNGQYVLLLRGSKLIDLTQVVENDIVIDPDYMQASSKAIYKYINSCVNSLSCCSDPRQCGEPLEWIKGMRNIQVTGDWGFPAIPKTVQLVTARLVCMYLEGKVGDGIASFTALSASAADSTSISGISGGIKSFELSQPGSTIKVGLQEPTTTITSKTANASKAAVESGLYLHAGTTGDAWSDSRLVKYSYKRFKGLRVF